MDAPPPPPPPHGANPKPTSGSGLPPGNYDIFIVPPHSAGSGFLYLPSLQPHRNSFLAGVGATLLAVLVWTIIEPVVKQWFATVVASGGVGVVFLMLGVGVAGWAWGKTQTEGTGPGSTGPGGGADGASAGGHAGPTPNGFPNGGANYGPRPQGAGPGPGAGPGASWGGANHHNASSEWEQARDETRKREEERKREEDEKRKTEEEGRKARAAAEKQKWEQKRAREKEQREREAREKQARERMEKARAERDAAAKEREAKEVAAREKLAAEIREQERAKAEAKAAADAKVAEEKKLKERAEYLKQARERADKQRAEREAKAKATGTGPPRPASTIGVGEKTNLYGPPRTASTPVVSPSPRKPYEKPSATSFVGTEYSFRPYDTAKTAKTAASSQYSESVASSYAASQSTSRTTPPPPSSHRGPYSTSDPDKIVIKGVYQFTSLFPKPTAQLVAQTGTVTDGLVLKIETEGLFIDDDVRGVAQREWDIRAWTMKSVETAEVRSRGCYLVRASIKDSPTEHGKNYVFVLGVAESWKVERGVKRLRGGSLSRSLKVEGMGQGAAERLLGLLG